MSDSRRQIRAARALPPAPGAAHHPPNWKQLKQQKSSIIHQKKKEQNRQQKGEKQKRTRQKIKKKKGDAMRFWLPTGSLCYHLISVSSAIVVGRRENETRKRCRVFYVCVLIIKCRVFNTINEFFSLLFLLFFYCFSIVFLFPSEMKKDISLNEFNTMCVAKYTCLSDVWRQTTLWHNISSRNQPKCCMFRIKSFEIQSMEE